MRKPLGFGTRIKPNRRSEQREAMNTNANTPPKELRVLVLEDDPLCAHVNILELRRAGFAPDWECVETLPDFAAALDRAPEVILADYDLPGFHGLQAMQLLRERQLDIPFIIISGVLSDATAAECIRQGASDCLLKDRLARLGPAVTLALEQKRLRDEALREERVMKCSEQRYRHLFETAPDGILILNGKTGQMVDVNPFLLRMLGYTRAELLGQRMWALPAFHRLAVSEAAFSTLQTHDIIHFDHVPLTARDGRTCDVEFLTNTYMLEGYQIIQCYFRDISRRRRAEELQACRVVELAQAKAELNRIEQLAANRQRQVFALRQQVNELATRLGRAPPYGPGASPPGDSLGEPLPALAHEHS